MAKYNGWLGVPDNYREYAGFVYVITCKINNRMYIGKKLFWNKIRRKPLKGKSRMRISKKESDWRNYYGSSRELLEDIEKLGEQNFTRQIINCYMSKSECSYYELKEQMSRDVLGVEDLKNRFKYYNNMINVRIGGGGSCRLGKQTR